jgi:hypothetical protein
MPFGPRFRLRLRPFRSQEVTHDPRRAVVARYGLRGLLRSQQSGFVFYGGGRRKTIPLHRLVALTFLPDGKNILHNEVGHLDGNRANAAASNLKWVSKIENHFHRRAHGTHPAGEQHPRAKLTDEQVRVIRQRRASSAELAAIYGVSQSSIFGIWQRRRWAHVA